MYRAGLRQAASKQFNNSNSRRGFTSSRSQQPNPSQKPPFQQRTRERLDRWIVRSPRFFKPTLITLRDAPASYIVSFAVLHEITAVVPLLGLLWFFHQSGWLPLYFAEGKKATQGVEIFGRWFKKRGWISEKDEVRVEEEAERGETRQLYQEMSEARNQEKQGGRIVIEAATAWVIVKLMFPLRIAISVWAAPASARLTSRMVQRIMKIGRRG